MITQTKAFLGIFKDGKLHVVIEAPASTTFYNPAMYTHVEGDTITDMVAGKTKPLPSELKEAMLPHTDEEVLTICDELGIAATLLDLKK